MREPEVERSESSARTDLREGFRYLARQPVLRAGVACTSTINFFSFFIFAIFVLYASRTLGLSAGAIGLILGAASFGALAGALIAPRVGRRLGIGRAVVVGSVLFPAPMALFPLAHGSHWLSGAMLLAGEFLASVGVMIFDVNQNSLMLMLIPHDCSEPRRRRLEVLQLRNEAVRGAPRRRARCGDRAAADALGGGHRLPVRRRVPAGLADAAHAGGGPRMSRSEILRHRPLRALLVAEVISTTGAQMTWLALPWFVLTTTGSAGQMTLVIMTALIGTAVAGIPAGSFVQRMGARRSMLISDALRAPLMLLVPILHWTGHLSLGPLLVLAFLLGMLAMPYFTAQKVMVPELLGEDEETISQANGLFQGAIRLTLLLGPPLGGVLIGLIGAANVLVIDGLTYLVSFALVGAFVPRREPHAGAGGGHGRDPRRHCASWFTTRCSASGSRSSSPATRRGRRSSRPSPCS